jgi:hypothetical protein
LGHLYIYDIYVYIYIYIYTHTHTHTHTSPGNSNRIKENTDNVNNPEELQYHSSSLAFVSDESGGHKDTKMPLPPIGFLFIANQKVTQFSAI